ncbi:hypothetical protein [Staphylococcus gallinarum]|uniref:hypothetical protein n=1 Tax=Staphylococcus gallinarum TaxID=1293 RepID=UPI002100A557|nr:hypothetical protein [Staphylococcus gallinarum]MCQ1725149.1 hypothetical protein [Escherichia coli]MEB7040245.1 hypothetical protein [Staphylococcus gallinarum]
MGFKDNFISFVPIIASFITSILGITTIVRAINRMFSSDNTIVKKVKLFFISLVGVLMFNVLFVAIILLVLSFTLFFTPFGSKLTTITIGTIILLAFLGLIAIIVKTIIERKFLLEIYFNLKYKDDNYKKTLEDIKLNVLAIEKAKITNQDMKLAERVLAIEKLKADKFSPKLNTVHSLLIDLSYLFYPALNTGLVLIAMNTKTKKELVIIIINVIAISIFNIIMMYRDIRLNRGMLTITEFILNGHFKRYQKLLKKQGKK